MNIRKPIPNPLGEPPKRPTGILPLSAAPAPSNDKPADSEASTVAFPTFGVMKPSAVTPTVLPPLPERPGMVKTLPAFELTPSVLETTSDDNFIEKINPSSPPLSEDREIFLRKIALSVDDESAPQTLYALATDEDWVVRDAVASNPETPESILLALSKDPNDMVRQSVMENESISDALLASFADDESVDILIEFIDFDRTTIQMMRPLFQHADDEIIDFLNESERLSASDKLALRKIQD